MSAPTLIVGAPFSGSGKTVVTLGLLRALRRRGLRATSFKVGPDYIDPAFHSRATNRPCLNLDSWAMRLQTLVGLLEETARGSDIVVGEGVMGLFDGAPDGSGSTADLAATLDLPVLLVVDAQKLGQSAAAMVEGFVRFREDVEVAAVLFNRVGSPAHAELLREAVDARLSLPVVGALPRDPTLLLPERHLGLVQACEHPELETVLERAADLVEHHLDLDRLLRIARPPSVTVLAGAAVPLEPPASRVAVARDPAFAFIYEATLAGWRRRGVEIVFFSPLADQPPDPEAGAIWLPGGYPELHAGRLATCGRFLAGLRSAADRGAFVFGECGGYMVLGRGLVTREGESVAMAGLLPVETSFASPRLHLGYREVEVAAALPFAAAGSLLRGHEFHFACESRCDGPPLFSRTRDARGRPLGPAGCRIGNVAGSFIHLIDRREEPKP
ncbi:Hydrogenobyrinate a,c-diamide synthase [bacterium HR40]|nr:Hydrogenobyrinate a,c-diamide synthase [bacterium HR40]